MALIGALFAQSRNIQCRLTMRPWDNSADSPLFVRRLRKEIARLSREQDEAAKSATFLGMTPEQEQQFHTRRRRIAELSEQLAIFEEVQ